MNEIKNDEIKNDEIKTNSPTINETEEITPSDFKFDLKTDDEGDKIITKSNKLKLALYALCFIAAAAVIAYAAFNYALKSPKDTVIKAYKNTLEEALEAESIIDADALKTFITTTPSETELSLTYKGSDELDASLPVSLEGSGLTSTTLYDPESKQAGSSLNLTIGGMPVEAAKYYIDETALYGKIPLLEEEWVSIPLNNIFSAYNASALSSYFGNFDYTDDFSLNIFELPSLLNVPSTSDIMVEYISSEREAFSAFKEGMSAAKSSDTLTLDNGKSAQGYNVVFEGEALKTLLYDFADFAEEKTDYLPLITELMPIIKIFDTTGSMTEEYLAELLNSSSYEVFKSLADTLEGGTYAFTAYVYNNKMVGVKWQLPLENSDGEDETYTFSLTYPSGKKITDKQTLDITNSDSFNLNLEITDSEDSKTLFLTSSFPYYDAPYTAEVSADYDKTSAEYSFSANVSNGENSDDALSVTAAGSLSQTDTSFAFSADTFKIEGGGSNLLTIGLDFSVSELTSEIEKPDDNTINLFTTDSAELMSLVNEVKSNYQNLFSMAALMGIGG